MSIHERTIEKINEEYKKLRQQNLNIIGKQDLEDFTGSQYLTNEELLNATAKGTEKNFYLDPIPTLNKLGQIYSSVYSNILSSFSARTDSIKMNRKNMDYTNDGEHSGEKIYNLNLARAFDINGDGVVGEDDVHLLLDIYTWKQAVNSYEELFDKIFDKKLDVEEIKNIDISNTNVNKDLGIGIYPEREIAFTKDNFTYCKNKEDKYLLLYCEKDSGYGSITKNEWKSIFLEKINKIEESISVIDAALCAYLLEEIDKQNKNIDYITLEETAELFKLYTINYYLNLLMPQYKRRVEVEDLNENFWVIGQVLDAVVNTLYGKNNVLDSIINLVLSNQLTEKTIKEIINYLNEIDIKIDIINKSIGIGKVNEINWSYKGTTESLMSFYQNFDFSNFEIELINDYGIRKVKVPIVNARERNGFSYEAILNSYNSIDAEEKYKNLFFKNGNRSYDNHYSKKIVFDNLSNEKIQQIPIECILWRHFLGTPAEYDCCMASFVNIKTEQEIEFANNNLKLACGKAPYCKDYKEDYTSLTKEDILTCDGTNGYYYAPPEDFEIILYDSKYYTYNNRELKLKDNTKIAKCLDAFNSKYQSLNKPILFIPSDNLYNGEIIGINFINLCLQDQVPSDLDKDFNSSYWFSNQRYFYKSSRNNADEANNYSDDEIQASNNKVKIFYLNKDIEFNNSIIRNNYIPVTLVCMEDYDISYPTQYTVLENLDYKHYYNIARGGSNITCYGYAGYYDTDGIFDNTAKGILSGITAYSSVSGFYQNGNINIEKNDYINNEEKFNNINGNSYDSFEIFKTAVRDQKSIGNIISNEDEALNYLPFIPLSFKVRNFPFLKQNYINSIKIDAEINEMHWYISAPTRIQVYTINPLNRNELYSSIANRSLVYVDGIENNPKMKEITFNFKDENNQNLINFIFNNSIFIMTTDWMENYKDLCEKQNQSMLESFPGTIMPRIKSLNFFGKGSLGAPGISTPHLD